MDKLPEIVLIKIFNYLNIGDLLRLRLTCKLWYELSSYLNRKNLCVYAERLPYHAKWPSTNQEISNIDFVKFYCLPKDMHYLMPYQNDTDFSSFFLCLKNSFLNNLKKLCLYSCGRISDLIKNLDEFNLEELFIYRCSFPYMNSIKSATLKTLCLYHCICSISDTFFRMYKLNKLIIYLSIDHLPVLSNPLELKYLECSDFKMSSNFSLEIRNLEILICQNIYGGFNLSNYPKLKQIHLYPYNYNYNSIDQIKNQILSKKIDLQFTISGYKNLIIFSKFINNHIDPIVNTNVLLFDKDHLNLMSKNYESLIIQTPWPTYFEYTNLLNCFCGNIPIDFFDKFPRIVKISISNKIDDEIKLIEFLKNCKLIRRLEIKGCELSKAFYDQLPQTITHLAIFKYSIYEHNTILKIDINFIQKLHHLRWIEFTGLDLSIDQIIDLFKYCRNLIFLNYILFKNSLIDELIYKARYNGNKICEYHLKTNQIHTKINNFNELIDNLKQIRLI